MTAVDSDLSDDEVTESIQHLPPSVLRATAECSYIDLKEAALRYLLQIGNDGGLEVLEPSEMNNVSRVTVNFRA